MREFRFAQDKKLNLKNKKSYTTEIVPRKISEIKISATSRTSTGFSEFDRVLGKEEKAGIVPGSAVLIAGDPGIGKSTLLLQVALNLSLSRGPAGGFPPASARSLRSTARVSGALPPPSPLNHKKVLYVTGEESEAQVALRANRLGKNLEKSELHILSTSNIDLVLEYSNKDKFDLLIIDSIQTMESSNLPGYSGSIPQVRHATGELVRFAKETGTPVILIGHVTKEGMVAGPMMLSHMVDTVLYLEGEKMTGVRILRAYKNRFGDTSEVGIFEMHENGMREITDLSDLFLGEKVSSPGSCITVVMEGSRPILVEVQALAISSNLPYPRRVASGISEKRLELLLAILQKHCKLPLDRFDIFVNVVGGFKISETASDLAVCLAILSSFKGKPLNKTAAIAEVGLLGELKKVIFADKRIKEAKKFGFETISFETAKTLPQLIQKLFS